MRFFSGKFLLLAALFAAASCSVKDDIDLPSANGSSSQKIGFDVLVTRDGKVLTRGSAYDTDETPVNLNTENPFGLVLIDANTSKVLLNNSKVYADNTGAWSGNFNSYLWEGSSDIVFSAYYPYVTSASCTSGDNILTIPYAADDVNAGPLVSKTVQRAINELNMVPLVFQHVTNDIGVKVCDATVSEELQGLIHLRKVISRNVTTAGIFIDTLKNGSGVWKRDACLRDVVLFEGDQKVGVGSDNEKYVGRDSLVSTMAESSRYYAVPDDIEIGKQYIEAIFDVEQFTLNGITYPALKDQSSKFLLYGVLPDNVFKIGKQYTFHIGLDLSKIYSVITFAPSVSDWESKIYEKNDDF